MSRRTYSLKRHGNVVTFKCGSYVEAWDVSVKGMVQTREAIRWAAITCSIRLSEDTLDELFREAIGLEVRR